MWLFPLMMWQKKEIIRFAMQIALISQFANCVFLLNGEGWRNGTPFTFFMVLGTLGTVLKVHWGRKNKRILGEFRSY